VAELQRPRLSVADRVGQVGFQIALAQVERGESFGLRLESDQRCDALLQHRRVGRHVGDGIGADVDHAGAAPRLQQFDQQLCHGAAFLRRAANRMPQDQGRECLHRGCDRGGRPRIN
jgi:hypothetical protein